MRHPFVKHNAYSIKTTAAVRIKLENTIVVIHKLNASSYITVMCKIILLVVSLKYVRVSDTFCFF